MKKKINFLGVVTAKNCSAHNEAYNFASDAKGKDPIKAEDSETIYGCAPGFSEFGVDRMTSPQHTIWASCTPKNGTLAIDLWTYMYPVQYCAIIFAI